MYYINHVNSINLRKLPVETAMNDIHFMNYELADYLIELDHWTENNNGYFDELQNKYDFRYRVKRLATINEKLIHNSNNHKYISKILNDLFGARIILENITVEKDEIDKLLFFLKNRNIIYRYYYRSDGDYHAFHCYIQDENTHFPWEFQIWDSSNKINNYIEHNRHEKERREQG